MSEIDGIGPDAETYVNEHGGKQSDSPYRFDLIPERALFEVARVFKEGAEKYGEDNWHKIPVHSQLNHALQHQYAHLAGDTQDEHLIHAACRALMALEVYLMEQEEQG